jgi:sodium/hydrogen exchanger 8
MGLGSCILHKNFKGINKMPELEASLIFMMSLLTYGICELESLKLAAVVAIFVFGIVQSHYNRYNLSHESVEKAGFTFAMVSYICEAVIIIYLGLSIDSFHGSSEMVFYVFADFGILLFSRFFTIFVLTLVHMLINKGKLKGLTVTEVVLVGLSGMIRGSLAYALVVKLTTYNENMNDPNVKSKVQ